MTLHQPAIGRQRRGKGPRGKRDLAKTRRDLHALDKAPKVKKPKDDDQ